MDAPHLKPPTTTANDVPPASTNNPQSAARPPVEPPATARLRALVERAQAGDPSALPQIRQLLDKHPEAWRFLGDLSQHAEHAWLRLLAGGNAAVMESLQRASDEMKVDLAGNHPTRLERMLADQIAVCWLELKYVEMIAADTKGISLKQAGFCLRHRESAQRRYFDAVAALTTLRARMPGAMAPANSIKLFGPAQEAV